MVSKLSKCAVAGLFCLLLMLSCAKGGSLPNMAPPLFSGGDASGQHLPVLEGAETSHVLWGYFNVVASREDDGRVTFQVMPVRQAETHFNVLKWLEGGPCTNCVKILGVTPSGAGTLLVEVQIKHPFSTKNLTGFDVRGIAMFNGSHLFPESGLVASDRSAGEGEVVNADGYTALYSAGTAGSGPDGLQGYIKGKFATKTWPDATLNPYKRFISDDPANTRNAFYAGDSISVVYEIDMPNPPNPFVFGYAVDANWAPPTTKPVTNPMTDFPQAANSPEPWKIEVQLVSVGKGLTNYGGSAAVTVYVYDWTGEASHSSPVLECPELFDGTVSATLSSPSTPIISEYTAVIENAKLAGPGVYKCLVSVEDDENASAPDWLDLTAYQIVNLEVTEFDNQLPLIFYEVWPNPQHAGEPVHFDDDGSHDPDGGIITKFEWDWENDGVFDEEGPHVQHVWNTPGFYEVQYRVTDDENTSSTLTDPIEIEIVPPLQPPVAKAKASPLIQKVGSPVQFQDNGSYDPDGGAIQNWEWDWNNDGVFDKSGSSAEHVWDVPGTYQVQFRVTDDEGVSDVLDTPLVIEIKDFGWAISLSSPNGDTYIKDVATDSQGNIYCVGGSYWGLDFDPGPGTSEVGKNGFFIASYTPTGKYRWSHSWSASSPDRANGVAIDPWDNIYMAGYFVDLHDFDPGPGVDNHTPAGSADAFLLKFTSGGSYIWGRHWGHSGYDRAFDVSVGDNGSKVFVAGKFEGSVDFDPSGSSSYWRTSVGPEDPFLSAFDSGGNFLWANSWGGVEASPFADDVFGVAADNMGNVYVTGDFLGTVDFDPGSGVHNLAAVGWSDPVPVDGYLAAYNQSNGAYIWACAFSGTGNYEAGQDVFVDPSGYVYVTGQFDNTVDFDFGAGTESRTAQSGFDVFLAKYNWNAKFQWVNTWGGPYVSAFNYGMGLGMAPNGNIVACGYFEESIDFDPGPGHSDWTSNGKRDAFMTVYTQSGVFQWAKAWGGPENDIANRACGDLNNNFLVCGTFIGTADLDPSGGVDEHSSAGNWRAGFLSRFLPDGSW